MDCFPPELFLNPYTFLNKQLDLIQDYPLSDGLDVLNNLREYLKEQAKKPLIKNLYTAFIHKYPTKESTDALSEKAIDEIMWAYNKQALLSIEDNNYEEGFKFWNQALSIQPKHMWCLLNISSSKINLTNNTKNQNMIKEAIDHSYLATQEYPHDFNAKIVYAQAILQSGRQNKNREELIQAIDIFNLVKTSKFNHEWYYTSFALALSELAELDNDQERFKQAFSLYEQYLEHEPDDIQTLENFISSIFNYIHIQYDQSILNKCYKLIKHVLTFKPNDTYNLACYYSATNQIDLVQNLLNHAIEFKTIPENPFKHLNEDHDLNNVRNEPWFIELLERLKAKEEITEIAS